jgi:serine/threonine protein kinase
VQPDTRTDIYAFAITLYQMLTGDLPLIGSVAQAHIQENATAYRVPGGWCGSSCDVWSRNLEGGRGTSARYGRQYELNIAP